MGVTPFRLVVAAGAALLAAVAPAAPVSAGTNHTITASPTNPKPGDTVTVTGASSCQNSPYTVTLSYTDPDENIQTTTASGTTAADGAYSQPITVPETAVAGDPASVQSNITSCNEGGAAASNTVALTITPHQGGFNIHPGQGPTGTTVTFTGAQCWGDDVVVVFTDEEFDAFIEVENVTLNEDRTFSGSFVIPDEAGAGNYFFVAECPGSEFPERLFVVTASAAPPAPPTPPAPPATPVGGTVTFTG